MIFLGLLGGLTVCGKKGAKDNSVKRIQNKKTIVLGTSADAPPFEYTAMKNGKKKIVGFDIMLGQKIADDLGVKLKVENIAFSTLVTELQDKKVDMVLSSMIPTAERKKAVSFSDPYHKAGNVLMIKRSVILMGQALVPSRDRPMKKLRKHSCQIPIWSPKEIWGH